MLKLFCKASIVIALLLTFSITIHAVNVKSILMVHPQSKKKVTLFHDAHAKYLKMIADAQQHKLLTDIYENQKSFLTTLTDTLLNADSNKGSQTIVITETGANSLGCLVEQEAGAVQAEDSQETLEIFPRMFLRKLFAPGSTVDAKSEIFKNSIEPFNNIGTASFVLNNKLRWIAGDRNRTEQDAYLSFTIYKHWDKIINAIESKEELPKELEELRIGNVREYIDILHAEFEKHGIKDPYSQKIIDVIDAAVTTKKVEKSDHFACLHKHLLESGNDTIRDEFNNNMISFISQKFDSELLMYLNAFEKDQSLHSALIFAGSEHNNQVRNFLLAKGYTIVEKAGIQDDTLLDSCLKDRTKLTTVLESIKTSSSFVNMKEILA